MGELAGLRWLDAGNVWFGHPRGTHKHLAILNLAPQPFLIPAIMVIYQHPSTLWAALRRTDTSYDPSNPLLPTRIRIKNNGDGTATARLIEAPPPRRPSFSLFNSSAKQGSKRKLSLSLARISNDSKSLHRDDEGFDACHRQGTRSDSGFGTWAWHATWSHPFFPVDQQQYNSLYVN